MAKTKTKPKAEEEELEELSEELDELQEDEPEEKPAKSKSKKNKADDDVVFGVADLVAHIKAETGKEYSTRDMRSLLRKMAREDKPRVNREVIPGNRARYSWSGPDDPEIKRVIKAVGGGEIEASRKEALDKLKKDKKAKDEAKAAKGESKKDKKSKK